MTRERTSLLSRGLLMVAVGVTIACAGCTQCGPVVWIESKETLRLPAEGLDTLSAVTHNGGITVTGAEDPSGEIVVQVNKRAGGLTLADAQACMDALRITTDKQGATQKLDWRYEGLERSSWSADVAFDVTLPTRLAVAALSHNGRIKATGVAGDCTLETHNGHIDLEAMSKRISAKTHNGRVQVKAAPADVQLTSHNGSITARLDSAGDLAGAILTHNGSISLALADQTATNLSCRTYNGSLTCKRTLSDVTVDRSSLTGRLGQTEAKLDVETHNGSIEVR